ncbi:MAG: cation transporter [Thermodesulfobacteriota bacterium]
MIRLKTVFSSKTAILAGLLVLIVTVTILEKKVSDSLGFKKAKEAVAVSVATEIPGGTGPLKNTGPAAAAVDRKDPVVLGDNLSKVVLNVRNMSCSGCISTIKSSVAGIPGVKETLVELGSGKVEIYFDDSKLTDVSRVAKAITDSGYPATVVKTLSAAEVRKERTLADARSKYYVVSVGGWDIARSDFETELEIAKRRYMKLYGNDLFAKEQGKALLDNLKAQILSRLVDEGVMMQEIVKAGFKVGKETTEKQVGEFIQSRGKTPDAFKASLKESGYDYEYFRKKFEIKVLINQYINERILVEASNDFEKQNLFNAWFKNSKTLAQVVYYDRELEGLARKPSASGGCSVSG